MPDLPAGALTSSGTTHGGCWADFNGDGYLDVFVGGANPGGVNYHDVVLINNSATSFSSSTLGTARYTKGVTACDWDEDGDMDIYVSIYDLVTANRLWRNNGSAVFTDVASTHNARNTDPGWSGSWAGGAAWGDIDNDGDFDLFAGNFSHDDHRGDQPESRFLENRGALFDWAFADKGQAGVAWVESFISPTLGDYDNDGDLDLFFTAVYAGDFCQLYQNNSSGSSWNFTNVTASEGLSSIGPTSQAAWADFDNDGDLDLITQQKIFVNDASTNGNHWLRVDLRGNGSTVNRAAIGAQVRISVPGLGTLTRQVEAGTGQGNQNELTLHFGLGSTSDLVALEITWPDGSTQMVNTVVDRRLTVDQGITPTPQDCAEVWLSGLGMELDFDQDCYIGLGDLEFVLAQWLRCNEPGDPGCEEVVIETPECGPAVVDFLVDFEDAPDLMAAPFSDEGLPLATLATGTNSSQVAQLDPSQWLWMGQIPVADQFVSGVLEFDVYLSGASPIMEVYLSYDDPIGHLPFFFSVGAFVGDANSLDLKDIPTGTVLLTDFMDKDEWTDFKIHFDADTGPLGEYDLYVNGGAQLLGQPSSQGGFIKLNRVAWYGGADLVQIDNISLQLLTEVYAISGNVGVGGIEIMGFEDCPVVSQGDGSYNVDVSSGWSGTVTPIPPLGLVFSPVDRTYAGVSEVANGEDYTLSSFDCSVVWDLGEGIGVDVNQDCTVNLIDFSMIANQWMTCNDPVNEACGS